MSVGSIFELYLLSFGWQLYQIIWEVLVGTGLAYLPFFAVIVDNIIKPLESQEAKGAAVTSLRRLEIDVISIIIVMILAVSPAVPLNISNVSATNACENDNRAQDRSTTPFGAEFDRLDGVSVELPPWWFLLLSVTGGINDAIISALPCQPDMRRIAHEINTAVVTDDVLRHELSRFNQECYQPGVAWIRNNRVSEAQDSWDSGDIQWVGSKFLITEYYPDAWSKKPVEGFAFDTSRESDSAHHTQSTGDAEPEHGYPSCYQWWEDDSRGLQGRLAQEFPPSWYDRTNHALQADALRAHEDIVLKNVLSREHSITGDLAPSESGEQSLGEYALSLVTGLGGIIASTLIQPMVYGVKFAAPLFQSMLLMLVYMLLPLALLFGKYSWSSVMQAAVFIFAVKFWTVIWTVLHLVDNQMLGVIKRMSGAEGLASISNQMVLLKTSFDLIILSFYVAAPLFFMQMLSWSGYSRASVANEAGGQGMGAGKQSGQQAVDTGKGAASKIKK